MSFCREAGLVLPPVQGIFLFYISAVTLITVWYMAARHPARVDYGKCAQDHGTSWLKGKTISLHTLELEAALYTVSDFTRDILPVMLMKNYYMKARKTIKSLLHTLRPNTKIFHMLRCNMGYILEVTCCINRFLSMRRVQKTKTVTDTGCGDVAGGTEWGSRRTWRIGENGIYWGKGAGTWNRQKQAGILS